MPLVPLRPVLEAAEAHGYAQGAFNVNAVCQAKAVIEIHELLRAPAILQGADLANAFMGGRADFQNGTLEDKKKGAKNIAAAVKKYGEQSPIPVVLHLDHGEDFEFLRRSIDLGFTSVMMDASMDTFEENVRKTKEVVAYAHSKGATVEAEIGHVGHGENLTEIQENESVYTTVEEAKRQGIELHYVNTRMENATEYLRELSGGTGYDDVICFAPVKPVVEQAGDILGYDGCLNFFAGPTNTQFKAEFNFYNVHYLYTHLVGTSGGNTDDMREAIEMMNAGKIDPAAMVTHIGGLNAVVDTVLNLPQIPGGKKLIYNQIDLPLTAIDDFEEKGRTDPLFARLDKLCKARNGLWNGEAEKYLLANAKAI